MIDQIRIDRVLQIPAPVVREQDVHGLGARGARVADTRDAAAGVGLYGVVDGVDDVGGVREEGVGFDFAQGLGDGFGAEEASDFLEGEEFGGDGVLDEVDVGEAALGEG